MSRSDVQVSVRLPADVKARLEALAAANKRSVTAEVTVALEAFVSSYRRQRYELAGLAMQGFAGNPKAFNMLAEEVAGYSVQYADALLAELSKDGAA